ncbi:hypothetical protein [Microbulbifer sp. YPW1]|uniref:hypothetical protein n=1 Tax=Microbulbifer sp. YPW1 TaxID=2745199 RepID=UPI001597996A|nr:hypothetical protein [Microbulbifer sp. YPW1]QKX18592.1 hypothetical protein HUW35_17350 [Microbulbifer sp. YPW1]
MKRNYRRRKSPGASILRDTAGAAATGSLGKVFLFGIFGFLVLYFGFPFFIDPMIARNGEEGVMSGVARILERRSIWAERLGIAVLLLCSAFAIFRKLVDCKVDKDTQKFTVVAAKVASRAIQKNT